MIIPRRRIPIFVQVFTTNSAHSSSGGSGLREDPECGRATGSQASQAFHAGFKSQIRPCTVLTCMCLGWHGRRVSSCTNRQQVVFPDNMYPSLIHVHGRNFLTSLSCGSSGCMAAAGICSGVANKVSLWVQPGSRGVSSCAVAGVLVPSPFTTSQDQGRGTDLSLSQSQYQTSDVNYRPKAAGAKEDVVWFVASGGGGPGCARLGPAESEERGTSRVS